MSQQQVEHPQRDELIALGLGKLPPEEATRIESHVESCEICSETILDLQDDTFVSLVRKSPPAGRVDVEATVGGAAELRRAPDGGDLGETELPRELLEHSRYEILQRIGRGGMGDVYKAQHKVMNRLVALKVIKPQLVQNAAAVQRFQREVQAAARLHHANIVTAYDAEQAGALHFLVMEFVDGVNLDEVIRRQGAMPIDQACDAIHQAALGMQHAHELGMVHRDIKPHNLMLTSTGQVKILDFGLASLASEITIEQAAANATSGESDSASPTQADAVARPSQQLTLMGTMMGTPDFMAPEQARDAHAADVRADIYSLGCTFYALLAGKAPFGGASVSEKIKAHSEHDAPPLSDLRDDVPAEVEWVLNRMLAKQPENRFQTPAELAEALARLRPAAEAKAVPAKAASARQTTARRRNSLLIGAALLGLLAVFAGVIAVATDRGVLQVESEVDDVKIVVSQNGQDVQTIDLKTGSQLKWLPSGRYEIALVGDDNGVTIDKSGFTLSRFGTVIVRARWTSTGRGVIRAFDESTPTISRDDLEVADGGWRITAGETRTVRLFETPMPKMKPGPFFYRAKIKTENVKGRAFLEMWVRVPGHGESFSKGFHNAVAGSNGWAEYEIPFLLKEGEQPDLVKLNVVVEGGGTLWIKDVELVGRSETSGEAAGLPGGGRRFLGHGS
ncbi:MAG: serine/threonine-protein kinase [Pirellulaceae bacterium]